MVFNRINIERVAKTLPSQLGPLSGMIDKNKYKRLSKGRLVVKTELTLTVIHLSFYPSCFFVGGERTKRYNRNSVLTFP